MFLYVVLYLTTVSMTFVSQVEPKSNEEALKDDKWVAAMHEELHQFTRNDVWFLVPRSDQMNIIGCKWVLETRWMNME